MAKAVNKKQDLKSNQFVYENNTYEVVLGKVNIPGLGVLTSGEVAVEPAAQQYLVQNNCIGSVIIQIH